MTPPVRQRDAHAPQTARGHVVIARTPAGWTVYSNGVVLMFYDRCLNTPAGGGSVRAAAAGPGLRGNDGATERLERPAAHGGEWRPARGEAVSTAPQSPAQHATAAGSRPRLLDLFCGGGGSARGYQQAGFHVTGVDSEPQPRYCGDAFIQADALTFPLDGFDVIHCSPPCQGYSRMRHLPWLKGRMYPLLIPVMRERLRATGALWVIENVEDAPVQGITLCGQPFGLTVYRHRRFESNVLLFAPPHLKHRERIGHGRVFNSRRVANPNGWITAAGMAGSRDAFARAMGIDWMTRDELSQAIPPAYTHHIGLQLREAVAHEEAV